jgi:hypothetical protein
MTRALASLGVCAKKINSKSICARWDSVAQIQVSESELLSIQIKGDTIVTWYPSKGIVEL